MAIVSLEEGLGLIDGKEKGRWKRKRSMEKKKANRKCGSP
jgi:hypothetical protein